jgi:hypothetical protein
VKEVAAISVRKRNAHKENLDSLEAEEILPKDTSRQNRSDWLGTQNKVLGNAEFKEYDQDVQLEVAKLQAENKELKEPIDFLENGAKTVIMAFEAYRKRVRALGNEY